MDFYQRDPSKSDAFTFYAPGNYGSFRSTIQTFYAIFQMFTGSLHQLAMYEATLHNKWVVMVTWFIIYLSLTLILKSLLIGFIWDVYSIVSQNKNIEHALT